MGQALFYKRMHGLKQKIYRWKQYGVNTTYTYKWNKYNAVSTTTYTWNKYNRVSTTTYTWNKWNTTTEKVPTLEYGEAGIGWSSGYRIQVWQSTKISFGSSNYATLVNPSSVVIAATTDMPYNFGSDTYICMTKKESSTSNPMYKGVNLTKWGEEYGYWYCTGTGYKVTGCSTEYVKGSTLQGTVSSTSSTAYPNGGASGSYWYDGRTSSTSYSQGSTSYGTVSSTSSTAYPSNGYSGSYWYVSNGSSTSWSKGSTSYGTVSSTNSSAYPDNGRSGSYWYVYSTSTTSYSQGSYIGDKLSTDRNAYPDNAKSGSYWYVYDGEA